MAIHTFLLVTALLLPSILAQDPTPRPAGAQPISVGKRVPGATLRPDDTIASYLASRSDTKLLLRIVASVGNLTESFSNPSSRFTVFAPTDNALADLFRQISPETPFDVSNVDEAFAAIVAAINIIRTLPTAKFASLRDILNYHVIGASYSSIELESRRGVTTTQGQRLRFIDGQIIDNDISRGNATASPKDVFVQNGWVNIINSVLLPFNLARAVREAARTPDPTKTPDPSASTSVGADPTPSSSVAASPSPSSTVGTLPSPSSSVGPSPPPAESTDPGTDPAISPSAEEEDLQTTGPSPSASPDDGPVCFPADATVTLVDGSVSDMASLGAGHSIAVSTEEFSPVFLFTHRSSTRRSLFRELTTASGHVLTLSPGHYVYANGKLVAGRAVRKGDMLKTVAGDSPVVRVRIVEKVGLFAPHTVHGDLIVNGVYASGYSDAVHPRLAHALLAPIRMLVRYGGFVEPLGRLFYDGADQVVRFVPGGSARYD